MLDNLKKNLIKNKRKKIRVLCSLLHQADNHQSGVQIRRLLVIQNPEGRPDPLDKTQKTFKLFTPEDDIWWYYTCWSCPSTGPSSSPSLWMFAER